MGDCARWQAMRSYIYSTVEKQTAYGYKIENGSSLQSVATFNSGVLCMQH